MGIGVEGMDMCVSFCKQKRAKGIRLSVVGSGRCIRDRRKTTRMSHVAASL